MNQAPNANKEEIAKFNALAQNWWESDGPMRTLHEINPTRLDFIQQNATLAGATICDVGCGGGILSENMAKHGGHVLGIDLAEDLIKIAKIHSIGQALGSGTLQYDVCAAETLAEQNAKQFDIITCLELLEHVPDPSKIVAACVNLLKPGGLAFFSTINRTPQAYALAILLAEYFCQLVPRGTHQYKDFITPSELESILRANQLQLIKLQGVDYNPLFKSAKLSKDVSVLYILCAQKMK